MTVLTPVTRPKKVPSSPSAVSTPEIWSTTPRQLGERVLVDGILDVADDYALLLLILDVVKIGGEQLVEPFLLKERDDARDRCPDIVRLDLSYAVDAVPAVFQTLAEQQVRDDSEHKAEGDRDTHDAHDQHREVIGRDHRQQHAYRKKNSTQNNDYLFHFSS